MNGLSFNFNTVVTGPILSWGKFKITHIILIYTLPTPNPVPTFYRKKQKVWCCKVTDSQSSPKNRLHQTTNPVQIESRSS